MHLCIYASTTINHRMLYFKKNMKDTKEVRAWTQTDSCKPRFTATLFTMVKGRNNPNVHQQMNGINKMWYIHTVEYYSALIRKLILIYDAIWKNLEDITVKSLQWRYKRTYLVWFHWHEAPRIGKFIEAERRVIVTRDWREEEWRYKVSVGDEEKVLEVGSSDRNYTTWMFLMPLSYTLETI